MFSDLLKTLTGIKGTPWTVQYGPLSNAALQHYAPAYQPSDRYIDMYFIPETTLAPEIKLLLAKVYKIKASLASTLATS